MTIRILSVIASLICIQAFAASPQLQQLGKTTVGRGIIRDLGVSATTADLNAALVQKYGAQQAGVILGLINQYNAQVANGTDAEQARQSIFKVNATGRVNFAALSGSSRDGMIATAPSTRPTCGETSLAMLAAKYVGNVAAAEKAQADGSLKGGEGGCAIHTFKEGAQEEWAQTGVCISSNGANKALGPNCMQAAWGTKGGMVSPVPNAAVTAAAKSAFAETSTSCNLF